MSKIVEETSTTSAGSNRVEVVMSCPVPEDVTDDVRNRDRLRTVRNQVGFVDAPSISAASLNSRHVDGVLSGDGLVDEQRQVGFDHAVDLLQLRHQVVGRVQSAGSITQHHVDVVGLGVLDGVVDDRRRITTPARGR